MNRQGISLGLALKEAGITPNVDTFDDRLILQKAVYLIQEAHVHLGYRYQWYLRGPYSRDLTEDTFLLSGLGETANQELSKWELDDDSKGIIQSISRLFTGGSKNTLARNLELLASVLFLLRTKQAPVGDPEKIREVLEANDKHFSTADIEQGITELRDASYGI